MEYLAWLSPGLCALAATSCASPELLWLHQLHGAHVAGWAWFLSGLLGNCCPWHCLSIFASWTAKKQPGLLLRKLRLVWQLHLCWPMPCCLCGLLSHPYWVFWWLFRLEDFPTLSNHWMGPTPAGSSCKSLCEIVSSDGLHTNSHSNISQWAEAWENQHFVLQLCFILRVWTRSCLHLREDLGTTAVLTLAMARADGFRGALL